VTSTSCCPRQVESPDGRLDRRHDGHVRDGQLKVTIDDAGDVEQIVDQPRLHPRVSLDHAKRVVHARPVLRDRRRMEAQPRMAVSGVRSSWDSVAGNSSF
jgi:hypothetical protein